MTHIEVDKFNDADFSRICESLERGEATSFSIKSTGIYDPMLDMESAHYVCELEAKYGSNLMRLVGCTDLDSYRSYKLRK